MLMAGSLKRLPSPPRRYAPREFPQAAEAGPVESISVLVCVRADSSRATHYILCRLKLLPIWIQII